ncbi:MAG: PIG-L family deacetylase [Candidatus Gastranaerophilaceae bacterium]
MKINGIINNLCLKSAKVARSKSITVGSNSLLGPYHYPSTPENTLYKLDFGIKLSKKHKIELKRKEDIPNLKKADVAIFMAHPDDEICFFSFIPNLINQNKKVQLVYSTSGERGRDVRGIFERFAPEIKDLRENELRTSLENLEVNINPLILGLPDSFTHLEDNIKTMKSMVSSIIEKICPNEIYTFGPEGVTNHTDHKAIGGVAFAVVKDINSSKTKEGKIKLYQVGFLEKSKKKIIKFTKKSTKAFTFVQAVNSAKPSFKFNISKSIPNIIKAFNSHKTQFTPETVEALKHYFKTNKYIDIFEANV